MRYSIIHDDDDMSLTKLNHLIDTLDPIKDKELRDYYIQVWEQVLDEMHKELAKNGVPL